MSRPVHFLDPYKFQIEEMVKLGCTDEHICRVLEDITGKEVKKRVIANKRMWLRKMENKRKQYEPYKGEIKCMIEYGLTIQKMCIRDRYNIRGFQSHIFGYVYRLCWRRGGFYFIVVDGKCRTVHKLRVPQTDVFLS